MALAFVVFALGIFDNLNWHWLVVATLLSGFRPRSATPCSDPGSPGEILKLPPQPGGDRRRLLDRRGQPSVSGLAPNRINVDILDQDQVAGAAVIKDGKIPLGQFGRRDQAESASRARRSRPDVFRRLFCSAPDRVRRCAYGDTRRGQDGRPVWRLPLDDVRGARRDRQGKGWKIIGLSRANCVIADVKLNQYCDEVAPELSLDRIKEEHPDLVVVATSTPGRIQPQKNGKRLSRIAGEPYLIDGMARTFRQLEGMRTGGADARPGPGAAPAVAAHECVAENLDNLKTCAFAPKRHPGLGFDVDAAERPGSLRSIDPMPILCSRTAAAPS